MKSHELPKSPAEVLGGSQVVLGGPQDVSGAYEEAPSQADSLVASGGSEEAQVVQGPPRGQSGSSQGRKSTQEASDS